MLKTLALPLGLLLSAVVIVGCAHEEKKSDSMNMGMGGGGMNMSPATTQSSAMKYSCPMHPEVMSDKPGSCPKCGMALVAKQ